MNRQNADELARVLLVLVRRMDRHGLGRISPDVIEDLQSAGVHPLIARSALSQSTRLDMFLEALDRNQFIDRLADDEYQVTEYGIAASGVRFERETGTRTMVEKLDDVQSKEAHRLSLLDAAYEGTNGNTLATVPKHDAYKTAGLSYQDGGNAFQYLKDEGLLHEKAAGNLGITHDGVKEREAAISGKGAQATLHFSQPVVQNFVHIHAPVHGSVQVGGQDNVATVRNVAGVRSTDLVELVKLLHSEVKELPPEFRELAVTATEKLREHVEAVNPNTSAMTFYLKSLETIAALAPTVNRIMQALSNIGA
jgi:hypothetical protein